MSTAPEFVRRVDLREIGPEELHLIASAEECAALAGRFALVGIDQLEARITLSADGPMINAKGRIVAQIVQSCAVSGDDLPARIDEALSFRFVPEGAAPTPDEEVELDADELDEIPYSGASFDLGEAIAQSLALAIDPYATGPNADAARIRAGIGDEAASGPFAALAALKQPKK